MTLTWTLRQFLIVFWRSLPWVFGILAFMAGFAIRLSILSISSWLVGVPEAARRVAEDWTGRAIEAGVPPLWQRQVQRAYEVVAYLSFFAGWTTILFTAFTTIYLLFLR